MRISSLRSYLRSSTFICGLILLLSQCQAAEPHFTISYWCGPPAAFNTLEQYQRVKDANFTLAFPPCGEMSVQQNLTMLDNCQKVGLKAVVMDRRMVLSVGNDPANKAALDAIVKDYSHHPALAGYHIIDEPGAGAFAGLGEVVAYLKKKDPAHPGFVNLLPTYGRDFNVLGTKTYEDYVRQAAQKIKPFVLCYDHYHFTYHGDREDFFENLETVRKASLESHIPFWNIVLAVQHFDYRNLTEPELRYEAMQTLAFGAKGLVWFTYWSPADPNDKRPPEKREVNWQHAMINPDGSKDAHYDMIKKINADVLAIGNELMPCTSVEVFQPGKVVTTRPSIAKYSPATKPSASSPIHILEGGDLTVGLFRSVANKHLSLIASRDYKQESSVRATIQPVNAAVETFDPSTKHWSPAPTRERGVVELNLPAGGGIPLRW